ncbi:MAG: xanthine dehydrogenase family protein subunit M [Alphaproteobacteria bacterium]|nr:xanthine dehydrogenase family protein subunit M [Alphaproteobacteria bacterium]
MYSFDYARAKNAKDAAKLLAKKEAKVVAGGMTLLPTMKQRLAKPSLLVDLAASKDLKGIKKAAKALTIGAMTTHAEVAHSSVVKGACAALAALAEGIGDPQVRNRGTIGGSIANNDPAADYPAACLALGATIVTTQRKIPADKFFKGMFETALKRNELVTAIQFPMAEKAAYIKFPNPASRYAIVGVFVAKFKDEVRVAVTGAGPGVFRVPAWEEALAKKWSADAIAAGAVKAADMNSDIHATAEYRAHLCAVMAKRAVAAAK